MRKVLLVLDYAIESLGGLFMFLVFFIGENKVYYSLFYQRILFSVGTFVYGVPIPIAYLLNESRVREIIVNDGWLEGFKAIFYSADKIRNIEIRKRLNSRRQDPKRISAASINDGFNGVLERFQAEAATRHENQTSRVSTALVQNNVNLRTNNNTTRELSIAWPTM